MSLARARALMDEGDLDAVAALLAPLVLRDDPEAIFLRSRFSLAHEGESIERFEARAFAQLTRAAELGWPEAMFELSIAYRYGDNAIGIDTSLADRWEARAAAAGYPVMSGGASPDR